MALFVRTCHYFYSTRGAFSAERIMARTALVFTILAISTFYFDFCTHVLRVLFIKIQVKEFLGDDYIFSHNKQTSFIRGSS